MAMVLSLSQVAQAATTWTQVSSDTNGNYQFEIQNDSIKKANVLEGTVNATIRIKRLDEYNELFGEHSEVAYIFQIWEFDCIGSRAKMKYEKAHYRSGQQDPRNGNVKNPVFDIIEKGSNIDFARQYVCKKQNSWQLPPPPEL